ncbi:hypothetical protein CCR75_001672 [Bremia lactucae]|uniref:Mediator complex subunit 15 KIX domain-containing protein n=1 Tax=Bremia lactucae TaxID=4779 RepID=A0A976FPB0_BRELC|nr:hypothetical protein CCR75_001672 [Bremia lactucae]
MEGQWRSEIPEDMRKKMITEMYHELARISGEVDKQKVWGSAAKFELMLWSSSPDRNSYLMKMQRKIMSLKKKTGPGDMQQQATMTSNPMNAAASTMNNTLNMNMNAVNMNAAMNAQQFQQGAPMNTFQQQAQVQAHAQAQAQVHQQQNAAAMAAVSNGLSNNSTAAVNSSVTDGLNAPSTASTTAGTTTATSIPTPPQQQAQQWLQRIQVQFQAQQRQLLHTQNQETQQLRQQHMNQQQQLSQQQQQQGVAPDMRRQQLQTLQQQHQLARTRLQHLHKSKQQQLQRKQQQYLMQKQHQIQLQQQAKPTSNGPTLMGTPQAASTSMSLSTATTVQATNSTMPNAQVSAVPLAVQPDQLAAAHSQQAAMREMQRAQNASQVLGKNTLKHSLSTSASPALTASVSAVTATTSAATSGNSAQTYVERLKEMKLKYWDDLVIVYREFERMVKQKPANQQQERINTFLVNLKRIIALLQQDPLKITSSNKNDLDRVEAHIHKQVLPILERLKNKTRAAGGTETAMAQQAQLKKSQEAQRLAQLQEQQQQLHEQQKADAQRQVFEEQQKKLQQEAAAVALKKQEMLEQQRQQQQKQLQAQQALLQQQRQQVLTQQQAQVKPPPRQINATSDAAGTALTTSASATEMSALSNSVPISNDLSTLSSPRTANTVASLTPAQYRTFKLPEARKQQLTIQHAKLREQQQELIMAQSRAKTPSHQAKLAHQAQRLAQMINKISQQLVQCKLAEEYEQSKNMTMPSSTESTGTLESDVGTLGGNGVAAVLTAKAPELIVPETEAKVMKEDPFAEEKLNDVDEKFKSVVPDMTGLGASEKLLTAVAAYEKHKPEVLKRSAVRFSRIAITIGAKLNTSFVVS